MAVPALAGQRNSGLMATTIIFRIFCQEPKKFCFFQNHTCIAYSLGVNSDVSFELDLYSITNQQCRIYSFDLGDQNINLFKPFNGSFRPWKIANKTDVAQNTYTVADIMKAFGHENVDFLKIDIEGKIERHFMIG